MEFDNPTFQNYVGESLKKFITIDRQRNSGE